MTSLERFFKGYSHVISISMTILLMGGIAPNTSAQQDKTDTLPLTMKQAETKFIEKNLELLAQHYDIQTNKALVKQAKLWDDPTLATDQNVYSNNRWFEHGKNPDGTPKGQYFIQLQQLIKTAGKRGKLIGMAQTNANVSEWQFTQVMQELKFQLRSDYYTISQLLAVQKLYAEQKSQLDKLFIGMQANFKAGNIARKDLLRIQALQIDLQQSITANMRDMEDNQSELKTLLQLTGDIFILPTDDFMQPATLPVLNAATLVDSAKINNAAYRIEQLQLQYQNQNLAYQKALKVPDVTVGPSYDQNSNYTPHYVGLGISLPLPILNGNRGNIQAAKWQVKSEESRLSQADIKLQNDVLSAYKKYVFTYTLTNGAQGTFYTDYKTLQENIGESLKQRQISLLEFIDYFNDYESVRSTQLQQQLDLHLAKEALNLQVGADVF